MIEHEKLKIQNAAVCGVDAQTLAWHPYSSWKPPKEGKYLVTYLDYIETEDEYEPRTEVLYYSRLLKRFISLLNSSVTAWAYMPDPYQGGCHAEA